MTSPSFPSNRPLTAIEVEELLCSEWEETLSGWIKDFNIEAALLRRIRSQYPDSWEIEELCNAMLYDIEVAMKDAYAEIKLERAQIDAIRKSRVE